MDRWLDNTPKENASIYPIINNNKVAVSAFVPNLLVRADVTNTAPGPYEAFYWVIKYRCASITEHCYDTEIAFELPAGLNLSAPTVSGNITNVTQIGNAFVIELASLASVGAPTGALAAGSAGAIIIPVSFGCGENTTFPAGSTLNFVADPVFTATGAGSATDSASDVTVPTLPDCIPSPPPAVGVDGCERPFPGQVHDVEYTYDPFTDGPHTITAAIPEGAFLTGRDLWRIEAGFVYHTDIEIDCGSGFQSVYNQVAAENRYSNLEDWIAGCGVDGQAILDDLGNPTGCSCRVYTDNNGNDIRMINGLDSIRVTTVNNTATNSELYFDYFIDTSVLVGTELLYDFVTNNGATAPIDASFLATVEEPYAIMYQQTEVSGTGLGSTTVTSHNNVNLIYGTTKNVMDIQYYYLFKAESISSIALRGVKVYVDLPNGLDFIETGTDVNYSIITSPETYDASCGSPTFEVLKNYNGGSKTRLVWTFPETCELTPGLSNIGINFSMRYNIELGFPLPSGGYQLRPFIMSLNGTPVSASGCGGGESTSFGRNYSLPNTISTDSEKWVKGAFDSDFSRYPLVGNTNLNGDGQFELFIYNSGFSDIKQLDFVDIMPFIGDTDLLTGGARNSEWSMELASVVTAERYELGAGLQDASGSLGANGVMYSTSNTPCYMETGTTDIYADPTIADEHITAGTGCTDFNTSTPALGARSFAFQWTDGTNPLQFGEYLKITFTGVQLNGEPDFTNGEVTWNSFGYRAVDENDISLPNTESIKVGLRMIDEMATAALGNYVWYDNNANGLQDGGEFPVEGVLVSLYEANGDTVKVSGFPYQTYTNNLGQYYFYGLNLTTNYIVRLDNEAQFIGSGLLGGYVMTTQDAGDNTLDSDAAYGDNNGTDSSDDPEIINAQTGAAGTIVDTYDFGFYQQAAIGNYVWEDTNGDGGQGAGEVGVNGVKVVLYDQNGTAIDSTTTSADGFYAIDSILPGIYYVEFSDYPSTSTITGKELTGDTETDSNVNPDGTTDLFQLGSGESNLSIDMGLKPPPTDPASISGTVWDDFTKDGVNAAGEPNMEGITIQLLDADGFPVTSTTTDANGDYTFSELAPNTNYQIQVIPYDIAISPTVAGADMDADGTGLTATITPTNNEDITGIDIGLCGIYSLGNLVWLDANENGVFDIGEATVPDMKLYLIDGADGTTVLDSTVTDDNGKYLFSITTPGDYIVAIDIPAKNLSTMDVATTSTPNSTDSDDNATGMANGLIASSVITITADGSGGGANIGETDHGAFINGTADRTSDAKAYYTLDFGLSIAPCSLSITNSYSDNCSGDDSNGYTADWHIEVEVINPTPPGDIFYQRNSDATQIHTLTGSIATLTIANIPADGGFDTLKVWVTTEATCADTIIIKRPVPCPTALSLCVNTLSLSVVSSAHAEESSGGSVTLGSSDIELVYDGGNQTVGLRFPDINIPSGVIIINATLQFEADETNSGSIALTIEGEDIDSALAFTSSANNVSIRPRTSASVSWSPPDWTTTGEMGAAQLTPNISSILQEIIDRPGWTSGNDIAFIITGTGERVAERSVSLSISYCIPASSFCDLVESTDIGGTVWEDNNNNGIMDEASPVGVQGIKVYAYDDCGAVADSTYTDSNGNYLFTGLTAGTTYRIEFELPEAVACVSCPTLYGIDNGTTVQFVQSGNCANLGLDSLSMDSTILEIGNYVWRDTDKDGIQDACESGISGVTVELVKGGSVIASTQTNANGQYYFSDKNASDANLTWSGTGADTALIINTSYTIRISNAEGASQQPPLDSLALTITNANSNNSDNIDNDASRVSITNAEVTATTGDYGCANHSFDFGFSLSSCKEINKLISARTICSGENIDTLAVTTTFTNPDSIAFVYFSSAQIDSSVIYTGGTGIDTLQIASSNDTVRIFDASGFTNAGSIPDTFYVYGIAHPVPSDNTCRPFEEMLVIVNACDWGDLPDTSANTNTADYQTLEVNNGPRHQIITGLSLGSSVDNESDGQSSADALGDGNDEDGLAIYSSLDLYPNQTFRLPFSYVNTTGDTAHVEAWIDWNADGAFDGVGEMVADWDDSLGALPDRLEVTIPANATQDTLLGLRIRVSHQDNMTPYGLQVNGEVEDYLIGIGCPQVCVPIQVTRLKK